MGVPGCLWGAEQGRVQHTARRGVGGPLAAVGASRGVGWGWEGMVGAGGREKGRSRGKRPGHGGSSMQSEQCYRQWRKCRKGGGGQVRVEVVAERGESRDVVLGVGGLGCGARRAGGSRWGLVLGVGRGGLVGGRRSQGKRSRPAGSGMQSEQCYGRWRKVRKGGGDGEPGVVGGRRWVRRSLRGGVGWGRGMGRVCGKGRGAGRGVSGAQGVGARLSAVHSWALGWVACGGGGCVLLPVSYYEEVMRV